MPCLILQALDPNTVLMEAKYLLVLLTVFCLMSLLYGFLLCLCNASACCKTIGSCQKSLEVDGEAQTASNRSDRNPLAAVPVEPRSLAVKYIRRPYIMNLFLLMQESNLANF